MTECPGRSLTSSSRLPLGCHALLTLACALASLPAPAASKTPEVPQRECRRILAAVASHVPSQPGGLRCTPHARSAHYTVVGVHSRSPVPQGHTGPWRGSSLVGYYGLHRASGTVKEWDIDEAP